MDLFFNANPQFTAWLVQSGALREPFVVVDVGVQGGENPRWHFLGDHLIVHGFDAIAEVIEDLTRQNAGSPGKHFHAFAIGDEDGERTFHYKPSNPTNSSFLIAGEPGLEPRTVPVRRLDTLMRQGVIPRADFLKVDVEGSEFRVFGGAVELLAAGVLGVECESNFASSIFYPQSHFGLVHNAVLAHGLRLFDITVDRQLREPYQQARADRGLPALPADDGGPPATLNLLFCRDLASELDPSSYYEPRPAPPSIDQVLKCMAICELHGFNDVAVETAVKFSGDLGQRLDVERAIDLLCKAGPAALAAESRVRSLTMKLDEVYASTSWRITAPLRALVLGLRGRAKN
jgi:FkbM family methyltransferase